MLFTPITEALDALRSGKFVALFDDCSPVPSLSLIRDAARTSEEDVSFLATHVRGVLCAAIKDGHRRRLALPLMTAQSPNNDDSLQFDFTVSVEARRGVTTGISASDRATTLKALALTEDPRQDLVTPGHIFPARTQDGGVLVKTGIPEAAVDLMERAQLEPVAAFMQCLNARGQFLADSERVEFVARWSLPQISISELVRYRLAHESIISRVAEAQLPISFASGFRAVSYVSQVDGAEHLALVHGDPQAMNESGEPQTVLVRVQAESPFGDLFGLSEGRGLESIRCALKFIASQGTGVLVYIRHPGRNLLERTAVQTAGSEQPMQPALEGVSALREMGVGAQILVDLGVRKAKILSNSKRDLSGLSAFHIAIVEQIPLPHEPV